ncbi:MAG: cobalamin-dependent protein, partial [Meiothermus ruber]|uniref:cobalamin-dependent protein n=1 Tax=Meiothermus ruber TaxID=277 RepID=UPI0023F7E57C
TVVDIRNDVVATVKGDVHDIGKNLVEIIFANNGYQVINLGIKVPPEELIRAYHEHAPDAIGLSGLLVKSAQQMVVTASDFREAGIRIPLLVGGAALSEKFTRTRIAPAYGGPTVYAKDAMSGLRLLNELMDPATRQEALRRHAEAGAEPGPARPRPTAPPGERRSSKVRVEIPKPPAPYLERRLRDVPDLAEIWSYINPYMLYGRHLGFRGNFEKALAERDRKALELFQAVEEVKREAARFMKVRAVWQFFEAEAEGNTVHLFAPGGEAPLHSFRFPRQDQEDGLALSDYVLPPDEFGRDHIWAGVVMVLMGLLNTMFIVPARSIIQLSAPAELRGRIMAAFGATMQSAVLMGTLLAGLLEPRLGVLAVLCLSGFTVFVVAFTVMLRGGIPQPKIEPQSS